MGFNSGFKGLRGWMILGDIYEVNITSFDARYLFICHGAGCFLSD